MEHMKTAADEVKMLELLNKDLKPLFPQPSKSGLLSTIGAV
jgi:hypothetical protein